MTTESWEEVEVAPPRDDLHSRVLGHRLAEARTREGVTQVQLAEAMGVTQARVSRIERGDVTRNQVDTLRAYVAALGGRLEVVADFGGDRMVLG